MASTAAGVAVGSTVGHGLSSMLFGGGSSQAAAPVAEPVQQTFEERRMGGSCDIQAKGEIASALSDPTNWQAECTPSRLHPMPQRHTERHISVRLLPRYVSIGWTTESFSTRRTAVFADSLLLLEIQAQAVPGCRRSLLKRMSLDICRMPRVG